MKEINFWCDKCNDFIDGAKSVERIRAIAKKRLIEVRGKHFHRQCWKKLEPAERQEIRKGNFQSL